MTLITSYNFVPIHPNVYFPDWVKEISFDKPLKDGVSGKICYSIKTMTPLFVRNGHKSDDVDNSFYKIGKNITNSCIPGSTIRGCIRNVLKIISFGKFDGELKGSIIVDSNGTKTEKTFDYSDSFSDDSPHKSKAPDLSETIFGYVNNESKQKGRVHFSNCSFHTGNLSNLSEKKYVLAQPRLDIERLYSKEGEGEVVNGWKRFYLREQVIEEQKKKTDEKKEDNKVESTIIPIPSGITFNGEITFHNLHPIELGGLLAALTFFGNEEQKFYHQIGQGKSLGYGRVFLDVTNICIVGGPDSNNLCFLQYVKDFVDGIEKYFNKSDDSFHFSTNESITEFLLLCNHLDKSNTNNNSSKKSKETLKLLSEMINNKTTLFPNIEALIKKHNSGIKESQKKKSDIQEKIQKLETYLKDLNNNPQLTIVDLNKIEEIKELRSSYNDEEITSLYAKIKEIWSKLLITSLEKSQNNSIEENDKQIISKLIDEFKENQDIKERYRQYNTQMGEISRNPIIIINRQSKLESLLREIDKLKSDGKLGEEEKRAAEEKIREIISTANSNNFKKIKKTKYQDSEFKETIEEAINDREQNGKK